MGIELRIESIIFSISILFILFAFSRVPLCIYRVNYSAPYVLNRSPVLHYLGMIVHQFSEVCQVFLFSCNCTSSTVVSYQNENFFIKMRIFSFAFLLSPPFITRGRMGAMKAVLILMKNSHFDRTLRYGLLVL